MSAAVNKLCYAEHLVNLPVTENVAAAAYLCTGIDTVLVRDPNDNVGANKYLSTIFCLHFAIELVFCGGAPSGGVRRAISMTICIIENGCARTTNQHDRLLTLLNGCRFTIYDEQQSVSEPISPDYLFDRWDPVGTFDAWVVITMLMIGASIV